MTIRFIRGSTGPSNLTHSMISIRPATAALTLQGFGDSEDIIIEKYSKEEIESISKISPSNEVSLSIKSLSVLSDERIIFTCFQAFRRFFIDWRMSSSLVWLNMAMARYISSDCRMYCWSKYLLFSRSIPLRLRNRLSLTFYWWLQAKDMCHLQRTCTFFNIPGNFDRVWRDFLVRGTSV